MPARPTDFARMPAGDRAPFARALARRHLAALCVEELPPIARGKHQRALDRLERAAVRFGFDLTLSQLEPANLISRLNHQENGDRKMDRSDQAQAEAAVLAHVLEGIAGKLKAERGLTDHQIGAAMLQVGIKVLSGVMDGPALVDLMAGATGALMEVHRIDASTGELGTRSRPN